MLCVMKRKSKENLEKKIGSPTESDAVFHEESEYAIGLTIRTSNDGISFIFRKY
jgi:aromatic ring hydroxylase